VLLVVLPLVVLAGSRYPGQFEVQGPEGLALQWMQNTPNSPERTQRMIEFLETYPKHPGASWVCDQLRQEDPARYVEWTERLIGIDPYDAYAALDLMQAGKSGPAREVAARVLAAKETPEGIEGWSARVNVAHQLAAHIDYADYARIAGTADPNRRIEMLDRFRQDSPNSPYSRAAAALYLDTLRRLGDRKRLVAFAETLAQQEPPSEDALLLVAEDRFQRMLEASKILAYCNKAVEILHNQPRPDGVTEADWNQRKATLLGSAYWMMGKTYMQYDKWPQADRALRAAVPLLRGRNTPALAASLFYLGWANYQLKNFPDAVRFNSECLAIKSPFQPDAERNLIAFKAGFKLQ
jgi:tetratricopeptide (TPR) repeat protein